jgi:dCTP deaminase
MLTDRRIQQAISWGQLEISGFNPAQLQPASYDVRLHPDLLVLKTGSTALDAKLDVAAQFTRVTIPTTGYTLKAGTFVLGSTAETLKIGPEYLAQVEGKSSLGRLGLIIHSTAGYIDPGFHGQITLEMTCMHSRGIILYPGMRIGQVAFRYSGGADRVYSGLYQGQTGPTVSGYHTNWNAATGTWL